MADNLGESSKATQDNQCKSIIILKFFSKIVVVSLVAAITTTLNIIKPLAYPNINLFTLCLIKAIIYNLCLAVTSAFNLDLTVNIKVLFENDQQLIKTAEKSNENRLYTTQHKRKTRLSKPLTFLVFACILTHETSKPVLTTQMASGEKKCLPHVQVNLK